MTIEEIQRRLKTLGYAAGPVDGIAGRLTRRAIVSFQTDNRLRADGIAGSETITALFPAAEREPDGSTDAIVPWLAEAKRWQGLKEVAGPGSNKTILAGGGLSPTGSPTTTFRGAACSSMASLPALCRRSRCRRTRFGPVAGCASARRSIRRRGRCWCSGADRGAARRAMSASTRARTAPPSMCLAATSRIPSRWRGSPGTASSARAGRAQHLFRPSNGSFGRRPEASQPTKHRRRT